MEACMLGRFEAAGRTIREKYCSRENQSVAEFEFDDGDSAIMIPPAPNLTPFIDAFHRDADTLTEEEKDEKQRQDDYEAEVEVFRALEKEEDIIVLHSLKYTHGQFKECVPLHAHSGCKKKGRDDEGECDFVVIGDKFLVVLEVKSPDKNSENLDDNFNDLYEKSVSQRERTSELIERVFSTEAEGPVIFDFSVFNRFTKDEVDKLENYQTRTIEEKEKIVLKDDMIKFREWWKDNVLSKVPADMQALEDRPINILLGLWSADKKNVCKTEKCSISHCILEIDELLKSEIITRVPKKRIPKKPINEEIKVASQVSQVFKEYLGIEYLTAEQAGIFKSKRNFLWIDGPAGSGKSVLLLGKIMDLFEKMRTRDEKTGTTSTFTKGEDKPTERSLNEGEGSRTSSSSTSEVRKSLLITFGRKRRGLGERPYSNDISSGFYESALNKANISYVSLEWIFGWDSTTKLSEKEYDVAIVYFLPSTHPTMAEFLKLRLFSQFGRDHHIFIDDAQCMFSFDIRNDKAPDWKVNIKKIINCLVDRSQNNSLVTWVSWDILQFYTSYNTRSMTGDNKYFFIRLWIKEIYEIVIPLINDNAVTLSANVRNTVEIADLLRALRDEISGHLSGSNIKLPSQERGHFIHGFVPKIYVITKYSSSSKLAKKQITTENWLLKDLPSEKLGHISCYEIMHSKLTVVRHDNDVHTISSVEWPATISSVYSSDTYEDDVDQLLSQLYVKISRARVYSVVILRCCVKRNPSKLRPDSRHSALLARLGCYAKIIHVEIESESVSESPKFKRKAVLI